MYARKSSESDERQAMSIDGQLKEMQLLAKREKLDITETITESHSAKESGQRPEFNNLLLGVTEGRYNSILTWAPDRLSRNAGDLGRIVDLMDQGKLTHIKTYSQSFTNNPNEKFLLMILCSQAKLENDNRGVNVKRGLRNKCQIGIRPGVAPIGYRNVLKVNRISTVELDPERASIIKQIFHKVAIKPGKPIWFGKFDDGAVVFALPGNPFSCMVTFKLFIELFLAASFGIDEVKEIELPFNGVRSKKSILDEFFPAKIIVSPSALVPIKFNSSGDITAAMFADAIVQHPADKLELMNGDLVNCILL